MKYEPYVGNHIEVVFAGMVKLANKHNEVVEADFNDTKLKASPGDNAKALSDAWLQERANEYAAYQNSPEGIKARADAEAAQAKAQESVQSVLSTTQFRWTDDMREISGFGGGYESACRAMVSAGLDWLEANPKADPKFHGYKGITGIITEDNDDAKELSAAVTEAAGGDCTGAMHQAAIGHALNAHRMGWSKYVAMMRKEKAKELATQ